MGLSHTAPGHQDHMSPVGEVLQDLPDPLLSRKSSFEGHPIPALRIVDFGKSAPSTSVSCTDSPERQITWGFQCF